MFRECQFADDVPLLATTCEGAEETRQQGLLGYSTRFWVYYEHQFMVVGYNVSEAEYQPIFLEGGEIEHVSEFQYLGFIIAENGLIDTEIDRCIANASKTSGALRHLF